MRSKSYWKNVVCTVDSVMTSIVPSRSCACAASSAIFDAATASVADLHAACAVSFIAMSALSVSRERGQDALGVKRRGFRKAAFLQFILTLEDYSRRTAAARDLSRSARRWPRAAADCAARCSAVPYCPLSVTDGKNAARARRTENSRDASSASASATSGRRNRTSDGRPRIETRKMQPGERAALDLQRFRRLAEENGERRPWFAAASARAAGSWRFCPARTAACWP